MIKQQAVELGYKVEDAKANKRAAFKMWFTVNHLCEVKIARLRSVRLRYKIERIKKETGKLPKDLVNQFVELTDYWLSLDDTFTD